MPRKRADAPVRRLSLLASASKAPGHDPEYAAFHIDVHPEHETVRVAPVGELDIATVGQLDEQLDECRKAGFRRLVLDLRGLTFMDSSGVHLVAAWVADTKEEGIDFSLIEGPPEIQRVFELVGVRARLPFNRGMGTTRLARVRDQAVTQGGAP